MIRRPPRSTHCISSAASDVYKRQVLWIAKKIPKPQGCGIVTFFGSVSALLLHLFHVRLHVRRGTRAGLGECLCEGHVQRGTAGAACFSGHPSNGRQVGGANVDKGLHTSKLQPATPSPTLEADLQVHLNDRMGLSAVHLSLIHISEPTRQEAISYAVFCLKKKTMPDS